MSRFHIFAASALVITATLLLNSTAKASSVAQVQLQAGATAATLDQNPVVSAVLSTPTTLNGVTTTRYIFLVDDGTGSMDVFGTANGTPPANGGYNLPTGPTVGDALTISGTNSPFSGIPELGSPTAITLNSSGNPHPAPLLETIPGMAGYTAQPPAGTPFPSFAGHLVTLDNVSISSATSGNYGAANVAVTLTDGSSNTMAGFYNPTTYALANQDLFGTPIATGPVNATGLVQIFSGAPELLLMSVTPVPEPSAFVLGGLSLMGLAIAWKARYRSAPSLRT